MSLRNSGVLLAVLAITAWNGTARVHGQGVESSIGRRVKSKVEAVYPPLARKMNISGTVKVQIVVAADGTVKDAKVVGGHPVLAGAAVDAVRKWRFEPAGTENSGVVDFKFEVQ